MHPACEPLSHSYVYAGTEIEVSYFFGGTKQITDHHAPYLEHERPAFSGFGDVMFSGSRDGGLARRQGMSAISGMTRMESSNIPL